VGKHRCSALIAFAAAGCLVVSCSSSSSKSSGTPAPAKAASAAVNLAFSADMQVPDPDIFYEVEGNAVVTSAYEGLLRYKPDAMGVEPALAESYTVSPDGLTYTFKLRSGITFHDGTAMDAAAVKGSFERRTGLGATSAPGYMLASVAGYDIPDPATFIVHLKQPVSAFLDYLASPYGPKVSSPALLAQHAGSDVAQAWLKTHDAGTGPYQISDFVPGDHYVLTSYDHYWGSKPAVTQIRISILPDLTTEQLKLQSNELQMIIHGLSKDDVASYEHNKRFQVQRFPANFKAMLMVNDNKGVFRDQKLRTALQSAIDRQQIVTQVFGKDNAMLSTQMYPAGELPNGLATDGPRFDPSLLAQAVKGLASKGVDLAYSSDDARNQRSAEMIQTELQAAGLNATVRGIPLAQVFDLPNHPAQAPDLLMTTQNPDASHPDNWARIFMNSQGSLNWLQCSVPAADAAMDQGLHAIDQAGVDTAYGHAGDLLQQAGCFDTIADVKEVIVAQAGYGHWVHQLSALFTVRFGDLSLGG
jgi:peptide/nickel transport system substrate-binding protein